jgi:hypothetical protein
VIPRIHDARQKTSEAYIPQAKIARHAKNARLPASLFPAGGTEGDAVDSTAIEQSEDVDDAEQGASQLPANKPPISSAAGISRTSSGMSRGSTMSAGQEAVLSTKAAAQSDSIAARSAKRIHSSDITTYTTPSGVDVPVIATQGPELNSSASFRQRRSMSRPCCGAYAL